MEGSSSVLEAKQVHQLDPRSPGVRNQILENVVHFKHILCLHS